MSNKFTIPIQGMHCRSCEIILEENIGDVPGIKKVRTNYKKGIAEIEYGERRPNDKLIEQAVIKSGYSVGKEDTKHFFSRNLSDYVELAAVASILFVIYAILKTTGVLDFNLAMSATPGFVGVLIVGLTAGVSTCMALIGGLVLAISSRHAELHPEATAVEKFRPHLFFNLGRLISYIVLGGVIGLIGSALQLSLSMLGMLTLILGIVMLILGLKLTQIFPKLHNTNFTLPKGVSKALGIGKEVKEYSHRGSFVTGVLTFFVPCGFTQAMQLYAVSTGSFTKGALIMGIFALGTLPGIIGIGGLTSAIKGAFARYFFKFAGLVVILLALFNIVSGFNLSGLPLPTFGFGGSGTPAAAEVLLKEGKQIVEMTQSVYGYSPRQFTVKKGVPVIWNITSTSEYTCAAYIHMPDAGISTPLRLGKNTFEFTPTKTGTMRFTCSMGMYSGNFTVVE